MLPKLREESALSAGAGAGANGRKGNGKGKGGKRRGWKDVVVVEGEEGGGLVLFCLVAVWIWVFTCEIG